MIHRIQIYQLSGDSIDQENSLKYTFSLFITCDYTRCFSWRSKPVSLTAPTFTFFMKKVGYKITRQNLVVLQWYNTVTQNAATARLLPWWNWNGRWKHRLYRTALCLLSWTLGFVLLMEIPSMQQCFLLRWIRTGNSFSLASHCSRPCPIVSAVRC